MNYARLLEISHDNFKESDGDYRTELKPAGQSIFPILRKPHDRRSTPYSTSVPLHYSSWMSDAATPKFINIEDNDKTEFSLSRSRASSTDAPKELLINISRPYRKRGRLQLVGLEVAVSDNLQQN